VNDIAFQVKCELALAFHDVFNAYQEKDGNPLAFFASWAAKVTLKLAVDEKSNVRPSFIATPTGVFSIAGGGELSANATRTETIGFFLLMSDLFDPKSKKLKLKQARPVCKHRSNILIQSDLKLKEWVESLALIAAVPDGVSNPFVSGGPLDATSHEIQFIVVMGGSITPTWKLISVTANPDAPFLGASRTQTDDLLITLGPIDVLANGRGIAPSAALSAQHLAAQIGQSVSTAIQSQNRR